MALINIDNGALAKSSVINDNFIFLDEKIAKTAQTLDAKIGLVSNNASTVTSNLANTQSTVNKINDDLSTLTTATEGKASKDLSDATIGKVAVANIAQALFPDYTKYIFVSSGWTATNSGWLYLRGMTDSRIDASIGQIDGVTVYHNYQTGANHNHHETGTIVPMLKGQVYTGSNIQEAKFYPCKGV